MTRRNPRQSKRWKLLEKPAPGQGRVIGHVRYSSHMQGGGYSAEQQEREIRELAAKEGWEIVGWCKELGKSAQYEEMERRPEFLELLERRAGVEGTVVITHESSRWARNKVVSTQALNLLRSKGVWWQTVHGDWDINSPLQEGKDYAWAMTETQNEGFIRKLSFHVTKGKREKAQEGYSNGFPVFGYYIPEQTIPSEIGSMQQYRRRRIVYQPHPIYFPALVKLGELLAQEPPLTIPQVADEMRRLNLSYWSYKHGERPFSASVIYHILDREYHREFAPGCGHGTIILSTGDTIEGLHQSAWPYEICEKIDANRSSTRKPGSRKWKRSIRPFSGYIICAHCQRPMTIRTGINARKGKQYAYDYYICRTRYNIGQDCPATSDRKLPGVPTRVVEMQFGVILSRLGSWRHDALEYIHQHWSSQEQQDVVDPYIEHERRVRELEARQERAKKLYMWGDMPEEEYQRTRKEIREELIRLPKPIRRSERVERALDAIHLIGNIAGQWERWADHPQGNESRFDLVSSLLAPHGLVFDNVTHQIVGIRPLFDVYDAMRLMLSAHGWEERDGYLWCENADLPERELHNRYYQIIDLIREGHCRTSMQIAKTLSMDYHNVNNILRRLYSAGLVYREPEPGSPRGFCYMWAGDEQLPVEALRSQG